MIRAPAGRAGRLWLRRRLAAAEHAVDLLERKLRILRAEQDRLALLLQRTEREWRARDAEAERSLLRATLLGGRRALALADDGRLAVVTVEHTVTMGVRYPARVGYRPPEPLPRTPEGVSLAAARRACQAALAAACEHAAATAAAATVDRDVAETRQRVQAIRNRWLPQLRQALGDVEFTLEEQEREDGARLRQRTGGRPVGGEDHE